MTKTVEKGRDLCLLEADIFMSTLCQAWYVAGTREVLAYLPAALWAHSPLVCSIRNLLAYQPKDHETARATRNPELGGPFRSTQRSLLVLRRSLLTQDLLMGLRIQLLTYLQNSRIYTTHRAVQEPSLLSGQKTVMKSRRRKRRWMIEYQPLPLTFSDLYQCSNLFGLSWWLR